MSRHFVYRITSNGTMKRLGVTSKDPADGKKEYAKNCKDGDTLVYTNSDTGSVEFQYRANVPPEPMVTFTRLWPS